MIQQVTPEEPVYEAERVERNLLPGIACKFADIFPPRFVESN